MAHNLVHGNILQIFLADLESAGSKLPMVKFIEKASLVFDTEFGCPDPQTYRQIEIDSAPLKPNFFQNPKPNTPIQHIRTVRRTDGRPSECSRRGTTKDTTRRSCLKYLSVFFFSKFFEIFLNNFIYIHTYKYKFSTL